MRIIFSTRLVSISPCATFPTVSTVIFPISPGRVLTDMAQAASKDDTPEQKAMRAAFPAITPEESAHGILEQVDIATRETHGGQFLDVEGLGKWEW